MQMSMAGYVYQGRQELLPLQRHLVVLNDHPEKKNLEKKNKS